MTKDEALDMALEVMQINLKLLEKINPYKGQEDLLSDSLDLTHKAITAIKQARLAPVQEPVGVFREDDDIGYVDLMPHQQIKLKDGDLVYTTPPAQPAPAPGYCKQCKQYSIEEPLPAAQRQWVWLTDEEFEDIVEECDGVGWDVAQAIKSKLKEKNT
jgi:hypothetical protein